MELTPGVAEGQAPDAEPLAFRAVRGGLWVALSSYFNVGFGFLANLALTRLLAPEHFGIFALAAFFSTLINIRPKLGVGHALAQRRETTGELVGTHMVLDVAAGMATLILAALAVPVLRTFGYSWDVAWIVLVLAGVGLSDAIMSTAWVLLDKDLHFGRTSLVSSLAFPLSYIPAFWLALRGGGYWSLLAQNATFALLLLVGVWWAAHRQLPHIFRLRWRFDRRVATEFVRFGGMVGLSTIAVMLLTQFDNFLVGTFVGLATLGFYDRAYRIAQWPSTLISGVLTRTAFYTYARLQDDPERLSKSVAMTCWLLTLLALPLALAIFVSAPDLVALLYGNRWLPSALFVRFLVVYSLLRPLIDVTGSLFVAVGKPQRATIVSIAQLGTLAVVATPLTLAYGATGTCVGVGVAFGVGLSLAYRYVRQAVDISLVDALAVPAVAAVLSAAAYLLFTRIVDLGLLPMAARVVVKGGFTVGMFFAVMLIAQPQQLIGRLSYVRGLIWHRRSPNV